MRNPFSGLPPEIPVLAAVSLSVAVGFGILAPAIPVFAREFGVGRTAAGAVISAFALMRLVFALAGGQLVDRFGERRVLATGIGIVAVSAVLAGLAQSYLQLLLLRGAGGIGSAMFTVSAVSLLFRVAGSDQRGRATGLFQGGFILGGITGPALGGVVSSSSVRAPFFLYAGMLAVAGAIAAVALRRAQLHERAAEQPAARTRLSTALRSPAYRAALVGNLGIGYVLFGARNSLIPLFVLESLRQSATWTGIGLVISSGAAAALLLPAGRFTDTRGRRPALLLGGGLALGSTVLLAASTSLTTYLLAMLLFGVGFALLSPATGAVVGDVVEGRAGTVVAAYQMSSDVGAMVGPLLAGWLADSFGYAAAFGSCAAVLALGWLLALRMPETRTTSTAEPAADVAAPQPERA